MDKDLKTPSRSQMVLTEAFLTAGISKSVQKLKPSLRPISYMWWKEKEKEKESGTYRQIARSKTGS
jgi:hypothetical protein